MRETETLFEFIDPLTDTQISDLATNELTTPATLYNQFFLIFMQNLEIENNKKRRIRVIKPQYVKKFVASVYEAVQNDRS